MTSTKVQLFLQRLSKSGLLHPDQLQNAGQLIQNDVDPELAARKLVSADLLTRWQARQLLATKRPRLFVGRYRLLKQLGRGAMGTVYRAFDSGLSRTVAVKVMAPDLMDDPRAIARFQREIRTAAALDHPHIVRAMDAGCEKKEHFLIMEYVEGRDLRYWIAAAGPLPVGWSCACIRQAAMGLHYAFERGVTHRDLKPSNLLVRGKLLDAEPHLRIVDFGLARVSESHDQEEKLTRIGRTVGTWEYMAPEQAQDSESADVRSDIFSLGCTLFQMISGALPFQGKNAVESLMVRLKTEAPRLSAIRGDVEPWLDNVVARMLSRNPDQRFQTPAELADALAAAPRPCRPRIKAHAESKSPSSHDDVTALPGSTEPAFDQFLQTTPDWPIRNFRYQHVSFSWQRLLLPTVTVLGVIAWVAWGILG